MYFSNITDEELKYFHKIVPHNFNMSLTDVLSSNLFYTEVIIPNKLYRVSLLFYCNEITSSNSNDVILENKCIICNKNNEETYFNFNSDDSDNFIHKHLTGYYSIDDMLSDEEFNSIVQLLRVNNGFSENIKINNSNVVGDYGTYVFNLKSTTIVDNGVLITNETLSSIGTVKLMNPIFKNSNYKLKLTVYSLSDVNVCNDSSNNNIAETELIIDLTEDNEVNIPFNTLDLNCIVSFNAVVSITHDLPVIKYPASIVLTSDKYSYTIGESMILRAKVLDKGLPVINQNITFKNNNQILGSEMTNSDGIVNFTYIALTAGNLKINATYDENTIISNNIDVKIDKKITTVSLSVDKNIVKISDSITITGVLKHENEFLSNRTIKIMNGNQVLFSLTTNANGEYSKTITANSTFNYDLKAIFEGDSTCCSSESEYINVKTEKKELHLHMLSMYLADSVYIRANVYDEEGVYLSNAPLIIQLKGNDNEITINTQTNDDGEFEIDYPNAGNYAYVYICYAEDEPYKNPIIKLKRRL